MSYAGRRPLNHPRYGRVVDDKADDRATPQSFVDELGFGFTLDAAAAKHNAKCARFFDRSANGLRQSWAGERVWINPPYSRIEPWVEKAVTEVSHRCHLVVMLLPANRTEQAWWHRHIEPFRDGRSGDAGIRIETRFLPGRIRFLARDGRRISHVNAGRRNTNPPFGNVLVIFRPPAAARARRAA